MRRRQFIPAMAASIASAAHVLHAEPAVKTIGILVPAGMGGVAPALAHALRELGYEEGRNLLFVVRAARENNAELQALAVELVQARPDLLVATSTPPSLALKKATDKIPIVMVNVGGPVETGLVQSLARPGGNVTGTANASGEWAAKRLQAVTEMLPGLRCLAYLRNPSNPSIMVGDTKFAETGKQVGLEIWPIDATTPAELERVLAQPLKGDCGRALFLPLDALFVGQRTQIADYARAHKVALFGPFREDAEAGALMAYGVNIDAQWRLAASYVDRILKGARPAELPVQQPTIFEVVINLRAANAIGVTIPPAILAAADEVIE